MLKRQLQEHMITLSLEEVQQGVLSQQLCHSIILFWFWRGDSPYGNPDVEETSGFVRILLGAEDHPYVTQRFVLEDGVELIRGRVFGGGTIQRIKYYSAFKCTVYRERDQDPPLTSINLESPKSLPSILVQVAGILDDLQLYIEGLSYSRQINATNIQYYGLIGTKVAFPISKGELRLNSTDPKETPLVRYNYLSDPFDLQKCMLGVRVVGNLTSTNSIQEYKFIDNDNSSTFRFLGPALPQNQSNNEDLVNFCRNTIGSFYRYHGGCNIGSVIDRKHRVKGVDNLRVVDGSSYIDSPGTNPQTTTIMLGRYTGIHIILEHMSTCDTQLSTLCII